MKKIYLLAVISALTMFSKGYGEDNMNKFSYNYGYQKYGNETVDAIQANGSVVLEGTKVLGLVSINGSLNAEESAISSIKVNGQVDLKNCLINNTATINGSLNADNTKFQKELSVASQRITLRTCSLDSLIVREVQGYDGIQIIDLRSGTKVTGPIVIESGNGEIWLSSNSEISDQVSGAKVYRK
ncbi:MAG: hypothetical protein ACSNEK_07950 [Parachlamydiaceae bacterium]